MPAWYWLRRYLDYSGDLGVYRPTGTNRYTGGVKFGVDAKFGRFDNLAGPQKCKNFNYIYEY